MERVFTALRKVLGFALVGGAGALLFALCANIFVLSGLMPAEPMDTALGYQMTEKAVYPWMIAMIAAATGLFLMDKGFFRWLLILAPIYAPSSFAFLFVLLQS